MLKVVNFFLYSNIFIAFCAVAMTAQTMHLLTKNIKTSPALVGLVFFSTLVIYAIHRLVSINKIDKSLEVERFKVIGAYQRHIQAYAILSIVGGLVCFLFLNRTTQYALVIPALLSLAYVIPFIGNKKLRLRDVSFVKIFLIAIVWSYVTVLLPLLEYGFKLDTNSIGMLIERVLFVFLITLPFDLRDWEIDKQNNVMTIPAKIGVQNTINLALFILLIWLGLIWQIYPSVFSIPLTISGLFTGVIVFYSPKQKHDYYFTALVDGTMIIQYALIILLS
jgi:4-hydroxybenzoate polyprenyltransferase